MFWCAWQLCEGRRGPHHPHGERRKRNALEQNEHIVHDTRHIEKDTGHMLTKEKMLSMSDDELEFYYFTLHDFDKNSQLDGLEMLKALYHTEDDNSKNEHKLDNATSEFDSYTFLIDSALENEDQNNDGFISYIEYHEGRRRMKEFEDVSELANVDNSV